MKKCTKCEEMKPHEDFSKDNRAKSGYQSRCKECDRIEKQKRNGYYRDWHLQNKYGITHKDYLQLKEAQDNKCKICGIAEEHCENQRFAVDHDHDSGEVRGLLCKKCNQAIGLLQDSSSFAKAAYRYLKEHGK